MVKLNIQGATFSEAQLEASEMAIFDAQWRELFMPQWSLERQLVNSRLGHVKKAIAAAKNDFKGKKFGGFNAQAGEVGISPIRPGHVGLADTGGAEGDNTWIWTEASTAPAADVGFDNWIHSPTSATTAFSIHEDSFIYPFYIAEESPTPILQTIKMDIGRSDILYLDVSAGRIRDQKSPGASYIPLPNTFWSPNSDALIGVQTKKSGYLDIRLGGFTIAEAEFLDATCYDDDTNTVVAETSAAT